jgi:hypothetical protein
MQEWQAHSRMQCARLGRIAAFPRFTPDGVPISVGFSASTGANSR